MLMLSQVQVNEKDNWKKRKEKYISRAVEKNINHKAPTGNSWPINLNTALKNSSSLSTNNFLYILKYEDTFVKVAILNIVLTIVCNK